MLEDLKKITDQQLKSTDVPLATKVSKNVPIYDCKELASHLDDPNLRNALRDELTNVLINHSGVFVLKGAFDNNSVIDQATNAFLSIIEEEKQNSKNGADHFAAAGANDRIWNSLEKLCRVDPQLFVQYHSNRWIELAAQAWLGPAYQVTAQVNLVHPGGKAQEGHCDYHLGFMPRTQVETYPPHVHRLSAQLTLQGAIAHVDMPIESGPTKLLPYSQNWENNYIGFREPEVREHFENSCVQLPLDKGDLMFFSPGMIHGAGENISANIGRMANLLQISSAFGIPLENINRVDLSKMAYPALLNSDLNEMECKAAIASTAEGYPFSTNLDTDPPVGGLAPKSQQELMLECLASKTTATEFNAKLDAQEENRLS